MARAAFDLDAPAAPPRRDGASFRVLIGDGDVGFRELLRRSLGRAIVVVGAASDGNEVVLMARRLRPDVVVMDVAMPFIDGREAARRIKADRAETKVVLLTSSGERKILHADALLPKEEVRVGMLRGGRRGPR